MGADPAPLPDPMPVQAADMPLHGTIRVPGSKSLTNRAIVLAALAGGTTVLEGALRSDDTDGLLRALGALGVASTTQGDRIQVAGCAGRVPNARETRVDLGDGGTPTRFMLAVAALATAPVVVDGSARMRKRPIADGVDLLRRLGVQADYAEAEGRLPVRIVPGGSTPRGGTVIARPTASSQFISALLLVAPWFRDGVTLEFVGAPTSQSYVELTVDELRRWGALVQETRGPGGVLETVRVAPGPLRARAPVHVEPDASSAAYWGVAAAVVEDSELLLAGLPADSRQPDMGVFAALRAMGAVVHGERDGLVVAWGGARGGAPLRPVHVDAARFPDGALALAAAAALATGPSRITGLSTLRVKESDRLAAMHAELVRIGCAARISDDAIDVIPTGVPTPRDVRIRTYRDHRIAMSFAAIGLRTDGLLIEDPACTSKSYPGFWADLARLRAGDAGH